MSRRRIYDRQTRYVPFSFILPSIGKLLGQAVAARDYPVIQATIMFVAGIVLVANLVVDVLNS